MFIRKMNYDYRLGLNNIDLPDSYCKELLPFQWFYFVQHQPPGNRNKEQRTVTKILPVIDMIMIEKRKEQAQLPSNILINKQDGERKNDHNKSTPSSSLSHTFYMLHRSALVPPCSTEIPVYQSTFSSVQMAHINKDSKFQG